MYFIEELDIKDYILNITFSGDVISEDMKMVLNLRDMDRFLLAVFEQSFDVKVKVENGLCKVSMDLNDIINKFTFENLNTNIIWVQIFSNGEYKNLQIKKPLNKMPAIELGGLCKMNLFKRKNDALGIKLTKVGVSCDLLSLEVGEKQLRLKVSDGCLEGKNKEKKIKAHKVLLKKRVFKNISNFNSSIELEKVDDNSFILNFEDLENFKYEEISILEFIAQFKSGNLGVTSLLNISQEAKFKSSDHIKNNKNFKFYKTQKGSLAIKMNKIYKNLSVRDLTIENENLSFLINSSDIGNYDEVELLINKKASVYDEVEYIEFKKIKLVKNGEGIECKLNLKEVFNFNLTNYDQVYEIMLKVCNGGKEYICKFCTSDETVINFEKFQVTTGNELIIKIHSNSNNKINVAVLGSCFSRASFNSKDSFFNLDYKRYFEVTYTHFWFSVISLLSEKINFNINNFKDISEKEIKDIVREYTKITFLELRNADVDYILIDFFLDAIHGVRSLGEGKYLAINPSLNKSTYYKNNILYNSSQFDYRNENYLDTWKSACDLFVDNLREIIGLDKVVLSLGGLTEKYYDENSSVKNFTDENKFTKAEITTYNKLWMKMNNYFLAKAPEARVLDMSIYNYIGDDKHPVSSGPHHYENNYYKSFLGELAKVITLK